MSITRLAGAIVAAIVLALSAPASAQNSWTTPGGSTVNGAIGMCLNNLGQAVPCSSPNVVASPSLICDPTVNAQCANVKPGSTQAAITDKALVTQLTPNSPGIIALGQTTKAASVPVTAASDQVLGTPSAAVLGSYCMSQVSGTMAAGLAANAPIASFRYGAANIALVRSIVFTASDTVAFVAGPLTFQTFAARSFTASDTTGNAATLTGNNGKLRTSFATTGVSDFRVSATATLTAGTRTLDATPLSSLTISQPLAVGADYSPKFQLFQQQAGEQPLQLAQNEGFVVQASVPGTGTWSFSVKVCWDEVTAY